MWEKMRWFTSSQENKQNKWKVKARDLGKFHWAKWNSDRENIIIIIIMTDTRKHSKESIWARHVRAHPEHAFAEQLTARVNAHPLPYFFVSVMLQKRGWGGGGVRGGGEGEGISHHATLPVPRDRWMDGLMGWWVDRCSMDAVCPFVMRRLHCSSRFRNF